MTTHTSAPDSRDPYKILGLREGAPEKEIKDRYRERSREYYRDGQPTDEAVVKNLNWAYELLTVAGRLEEHEQQQTKAKIDADVRRRAEARARRAAERSAGQARAVGDDFRPRRTTETRTHSTSGGPATTRASGPTAATSGSSRAAPPSGGPVGPPPTSTPEPTPRPRPSQSGTRRTTSPAGERPPATAPRRRQQPTRPRPAPKPPPSTAPSRPLSGRRITAVLLGAALTLAAIVALHDAANHSSSDTNAPLPSTLSTTPSHATPTSPPASSLGTSVAAALPITPGIEETGNSGTVAYGEGSCGPEQGQFWKAALNRGDRVTIVWGGPNSSAMGLDIWPPGTTNINGSGEGRVASQSTAGEHTAETFTAPASGVYPIVIDDSCGSPGEFHFRLTAQRPQPKPQQSQPTSRTQTTPPQTEQRSKASQQHEADPHPSSPHTTTSAPPATNPQVEGGNQAPTQSKPTPAPSIEGQSPSEGNNGVEGGTQ